jgi:transposase-like protein
MPSPKRKRTLFPEEFKAKLVARAMAGKASGKETMTAIAEETGVDLTTLSTWVRKEKQRLDYQARSQKRVATRRANIAAKAAGTAPAPSTPPSVLAKNGASTGAPAITLGIDGLEEWVRELVRAEVRRLLGESLAGRTHPGATHD